MATKGNGSITEAFETPEVIERIRAELVIEFSPKRVAKRLGVPQALVARVRNASLREPEFQESLRAYREGLTAAALDAFAQGLEKARKLARSPNPIAAAQATRILVSAPGEIAKAYSKADEEAPTEEAPTIEYVFAVPPPQTPAPEADDQVQPAAEPDEARAET